MNLNAHKYINCVVEKERHTTSLQIYRRMVRMIDETIRWKINTEHYEHTVTSPPPPSLCDLPSHSNFGSYRNVFRKTQQEKIAELIHRPKNRLSFIIFNVLENACAINKTQFKIFGKLYPNDGVEKSEKERMPDCESVENGPIDALDGMVQNNRIYL